jgi:hypothetical protein
VPHSSIEHHRRLLFLLSSTKTQLHPAEPLTRPKGPEVNSSVAECATGQSIPDRSSPTAHCQTNPSPLGTSLARERASHSNRRSASTSSTGGSSPSATVRNSPYRCPRNSRARAKTASASALVEGFRWAFYAGAVLAVLGALIQAKASGDGEPRSGHAARG